ncbi:hypothetical protein FDECE_9853 [Fusarium decemcellulare]|nr:hypothetical protein FDECE_9853 [Fusarium decemcellulare]
MDSSAKTRSSPPPAVPERVNPGGQKEQKVHLRQRTLRSPAPELRSASSTQQADASTASTSPPANTMPSSVADKPNNSPVVRRIMSPSVAQSPPTGHSDRFGFRPRPVPLMTARDKTRSCPKAPMMNDIARLPPSPSPDWEPSDGPKHLILNDIVQAKEADDQYCDAIWEATRQYTSKLIRVKTAAHDRSEVLRKSLDEDNKAVPSLEQIIDTSTKNFAEATDQVKETTSDIENLQKFINAAEVLSGKYFGLSSEAMQDFRNKLKRLEQDLATAKDNVEYAKTTRAPAVMRLNELRKRIDDMEREMKALENAKMEAEEAIGGATAFAMIVRIGGKGMGELKKKFPDFFTAGKDMAKDMNSALI